MDRRLRFRKSSNFIVYYGKDNVQELCKYNVAIVEPLGQNAANVKVMKDSGVLVIAYISVIEIQAYSEFYKLLKEEDFLDVNGVKLRNDVFNSALVDLRSPRWNSILIHHIGSLLYNYGYDGIFLDTIGDIEFPSIPAEYQNLLLNAAVNFIRNIRESFEDIVIIQNNGLQKLCTLTGTLIDGVCFENPPVDIKGSKQWVKSITRELVYFKDSLNAKILILTDALGKDNDYKEKIEELAKENNFLLYQAPYRYL
jgi:polysaccharide biosynthesis protein PelA